MTMIEEIEARYSDRLNCAPEQCREDIAYLLAEVKRLEAERAAAYAAGQEAMREEAAQVADDEPEFPSAKHTDVSDTIKMAWDAGHAQVVLQWAAHKTKECIAAAIRALPVKEG